MWSYASDGSAPTTVTRAGGIRTAVVALKPARAAKSRLASVGDSLRQELAWAMALDTLTALVEVLDQVLVVGAVPAADLSHLVPQVVVLPDPEVPGLNAALAHGAANAVAGGATTVLACVGDLPALTAGSLRAVLSAAEAYPRSFVADASGLGTTMLIAQSAPLRPYFGGRSADVHTSSGAQPLPPRDVAVPDARADVDTEDDLALVRRIGLGQATAHVLDRAGRI